MPGMFSSRCCCGSLRFGCAASMAGMTKATDRRLQVAFGIDQEVGGHHHWLAAPDAFQHLDIVVATLAELDFARLESSFLGLDQHDTAGAAVNDRRRWHGHHLTPCGYWQFDLSEHRGLDKLSWIREFDTYRH